VAAPFKNLRKEELRKSEFIFFLAIDRKWMNKDQANQLLALAEREGLIRQNGGFIIPTFALAEVSIPLGYKPPSDIFEQKDPVSDLVERIAVVRGVDSATIASEMNTVIENMFDGKLRAEAAVVLLAKKYLVPFEDLLIDLKENAKQKKG
jgi:hypothetical protein